MKEKELLLVDTKTLVDQHFEVATTISKLLQLIFLFVHIHENLFIPKLYTKSRLHLDESLSCKIVYFYS